MCVRNCFSVKIVCPYDPRAIRTVLIRSVKTSDDYLAHCNGCDFFGLHGKGCSQCTEAVIRLFTYHRETPISEPIKIKLWEVLEHDGPE